MKTREVRIKLRQPKWCSDYHFNEWVYFYFGHGADISFDNPLHGVDMNAVTIEILPDKSTSN